MRLTKRLHRILVCSFIVFGIGLVIWIQDARAATYIFLVATCIESGLFSLVFGLRSRWRRSDASSALFWIVLAYFLLSAHIIVSFAYTPNYALRDDIRQFLYLNLTVCGLNLILTMIRLQNETRGEVKELARKILRGQDEEVKGDSLP